MRGLGVVVVLVVVVLMVLVIGSWEVNVEASVVVLLKKKLKNEKVVPAESTSLFFVTVSGRIAALVTSVVAVS